MDLSRAGGVRVLILHLICWGVRFSIHGESVEDPTVLAEHSKHQFLPTSAPPASEPETTWRASVCGAVVRDLKSKTGF